MVAFLFQVFVNVGMTMGIAPVTGHPAAVRHGRRLVDGRQPDRDRRAPGDPRPRPHRPPPGALMATLNPLGVWGVFRELRSAAEDTPAARRQRRRSRSSSRRSSRHGGAPGVVRVGGRRRGRGRRSCACSPARRARRTSASCARRTGPACPSSAVQTGTRDVRRALRASRPTSSRARPAPASPSRSSRRVLAGAARRRRDSGLAARLPVLREAVCDALIERFSRQNGIIGVVDLHAGRRLPGADAEPDPARAAARGRARRRARPEPAARGARDRRRGLRLPHASRGRLLGSVPFAGWAVKGGDRLRGTRALGEAARRYFASAEYAERTARSGARRARGPSRRRKQSVRRWS